MFMKVVIPRPHQIYMFHNAPKIVKHKQNNSSHTKVKYQSYSRLNILLKNSFKSINSKLSWKFGKFSRKKGICLKTFSRKLRYSCLDLRKIWLCQVVIFYFYLSIYFFFFIFRLLHLGNTCILKAVKELYFEQPQDLSILCWSLQN